MVSRYRYALAGFLLVALATPLTASSAQAQWQPHTIKVGDGHVVVSLNVSRIQPDDLGIGGHRLTVAPLLHVPMRILQQSFLALRVHRRLLLLPTTAECEECAEYDGGHVD